MTDAKTEHERIMEMMEFLVDYIDANGYASDPAGQKILDLLSADILRLCELAHPARDPADDTHAIHGGDQTWAEQVDVEPDCAGGK